MRVVVHHPERTEDGEAVPASVSAYRLGRITDDTGINHFTGEVLTREQQVEALLAQAQAEYPDLEVTVEHLHATDHDEDGVAVAHEWRGEPPASPVPAGEPHEQELSVAQEQATIIPSDGGQSA